MKNNKYISEAQKKLLQEANILNALINQDQLLKNLTDTNAHYGNYKEKIEVVLINVDMK